MINKQKYYQGFFRPKNIKKYKGDFTNIVYRSSWELKTMMYMDTNPYVIEWKSEEIFIPYISPKDNCVHRYFPDFWMKVQTKTGLKTFLVEVKPECQIQPPKKRKKVTQRYLNEVMTFSINQAKWQAADTYCKKMGWEFTTLNEYEIGVKKTPIT